MLSDLRSLVIKHPALTLSPTVGQVLHILENSPIIETLVLDSIKFDYELYEKKVELPKVAVNRLRRLDVNISPRFAEAILDHIQAPTCEALRIQSTLMHPETLPSDTFSTCMDPFISLLASSVQSADLMSINVDRESTECKMTNFAFDWPIHPRAAIVR